MYEEVKNRYHSSDRRREIRNSDPHKLKISLNLNERIKSRDTRLESEDLDTCSTLVKKKAPVHISFSKNSLEK